MKLLETYSNNSSVKIKHKPVSAEKFFPLGNIEKYITLQSSSGMLAKNYSYFEEVVTLLLPVLEKQGIKIVHLGKDDNTPPIAGVIDLRNQTSFGQACYIAKKALLHAGVDSWVCHYAGANEIPLVALYGSTTVANHSPYHFNKDKTIFLESHRNGNKATFSREENPKTVDFILPEDIVKSVCKLLNLEFNYLYRTLKIGPNFHNRIVESACDSVIDISKLGMQSIVMRMDYCFILQNLINQLQISKCSIVTNKPIPLDILNQLRPNVVDIYYEINKDHSPSFCKQLLQNKIPYKLFTRLSEEELNPIKLDYLDLPVVGRLNSLSPDVLKDKDLDKIWYKSSKLTLGKNAIFQSKFDYDSNRPISNFQPTPQKLVNINIEELFRDSDNLYFLEKVLD